MLEHPEIQVMYDEYYKSGDLIYFEDRRPEVKVCSASIRDGKLIEPAGFKLVPQLIRNRQLRLQTLSGIGDCFWTRGIIRETLKVGLKVWVDTAFPFVFWDFVDNKGFNFWTPDCLHHGQYSIRTATYLGQDLKGQGESVYSAMCKRCHTPLGDFSFTPRADWIAEADRIIASLNIKKPIMLYRPLVRNHGRRSVSSRNPDFQAYSQVYKSIRSHFHVISVCGGSGESIEHCDESDTQFNGGELSLQTLMGLFYRAKLVFTSAGMGLVAAAAMGVPVLAIHGGYEGSSNYRHTTVYGPALLVDCINQCYCMSDNHPCDKTVNIQVACQRAINFVQELLQ